MKHGTQILDASIVKYLTEDTKKVKVELGKEGMFMV
jgi:hypothetical protein